jgi:hypothetical protein
MLEASSGMPGRFGTCCQVTKSSGLIANHRVMRRRVEIHEHLEAIGKSLAQAEVGVAAPKRAGP